MTGRPIQRILILGGTAEASLLARRLAGHTRFIPTLSLAGRVASPAPQPVQTRVGGFGGVDGLARWLETERIRAVIDATHPYAARISANSAAACEKLGLPLASLIRPPWTQQDGDRWTKVESMESAASLLATEAQPRRVFLSIGRLELGAFAAAPQHDYLARMIDPPSDAASPPRIRFLFARGPFDRGAETALLEAERIEIIVSKNSGGTATYAKIAAARALGLPVIMIRRPHKPAGHRLDSMEDAMPWLEEMARHGLEAPSPRGV